jgi:hypothetical protein
MGGSVDAAASFRQSLLALASAHMNVTLAAGAHLRVSQAGTALTTRAAVGDE